MKCNQCGKEIPLSNKHTVSINGKSVILCDKHYSQWIKYGKFLDDNQTTCFDANDFEISEEGVWVFCRNRQGEISGKFLIDREDLEKVIIKKWRFWKNQFFTGNYKPISIYRYLLQPKENEVVDHINGKVWDNRRCNLRITSQQNNLINKAMQINNKSGVAGVCWDKARKRWAVEIRLKYVRVHLGRYDRIEDAVWARYVAEIQVFKEYRSTRNDAKILEYISRCSNKEEIQLYVEEKLRSYFQ